MSTDRIDITRQIATTSSKETLFLDSSHEALTLQKHNTPLFSVADNLANYASFAIISPPRFLSGAVIAKIEDMMEQMVDCLLRGNKELTVHLRSRARSQQSLDASTVLKTDSADKKASAIVWPGKTQKEAWKFSALLRILELSHEALVSGSIMTKRDIYYRDPELFVNQKVVDRYIDECVHTLGVQRRDLNVVAAAKGLVSGPILIHKSNGTALDCMADGGVLIPPIDEISSVSVTSPFGWILIVEKEAIFQHLSRNDIFVSTSQDLPFFGSGIVITGKGYPDLVTRAFVSCMARTLNAGDVAVFTLVDWDPDGIAIHLNYKYGSLQHADVSLLVGNAVHLGNRYVHLPALSCKPYKHYPELRLSRRDRILASRLLETLHVQSDRNLMSELQLMLVVNMKYELQLIYESCGPRTGNVTLVEFILSEMASCMESHREGRLRLF